MIKQWFGGRSAKPAASASPLSNTTVTLTVAAFLTAASTHLIAMPAWLAATIVSAAVWRIATAWMNWKPPHWSLRVTLTFVALGSVIVAYGSLWGRRAATALLCVMMAAKLMEMFQARDARQIAALGFFLVAAQFLFGQQLNLLPYLLASCALATGAMIRIQRDEDQAYRSARQPANTAQADDAVQSRTRWTRELKSGLVLMLLAGPFALALFTVFPRLGSPIWGMPEDALDGRTGLSEEMSPGSIASLYIDDSPAFRVQFDGQKPEQQALYWRGPVLWRFDGTTWRKNYFSNRTPERLPSNEAPLWQYTVQLEPNERRWLFTLDYPVEWSEQASLSADFQLVRKRPVTRLISYQVASQPNFIDSPELMETLRLIALELPEGQNPRTRARAEQFREQYPNDRDLINAVLSWFNQDEFFYSLETMPLGWNGADEFLFDLKTGYCEYYASAFAVLMRAAGIPARVVTGYQGGFWQGSSEYLLVRQSDAHAWVEVWLEGTGWTRVDPTAAVSPSRIRENARSALNEPLRWLDAQWLQNLRNEYDRLQHYWNQWVLGFNASRQQQFFSKIGLDQLSGPLMGLFVALIAVITIAPIAFLLRSLGQSRLRLSQEQRYWHRLIRRLRKYQLKPAPAETALEFALRASAFLNNGDELIKAAKLYCQLRYAEPATAHANLMLLMQRYSQQWKPDINQSRLKSTGMARLRSINST